MPGPALRLYGDGRASPLSVDGQADENPLSAQQRELSTIKAQNHGVSRPTGCRNSSVPSPLNADMPRPVQPAGKSVSKLSKRLSAPGGPGGAISTSAKISRDAAFRGNHPPVAANRQAAVEAGHGKMARRRATWSQGQHAHSTDSHAPGSSSQLSVQQRAVAHAAVQGAPISPAGLPHDAWRDGDPIQDVLSLPPGLDRARRRKPFALPSRQELAQVGVIGQGSDVADEASSQTTSQRSVRPSVAAARSASHRSNPIFGGDRPQARVTVHENMAAWLASDSVAASPDMSPQPSLSVPLLRASTILQASSPHEAAQGGSSSTVQQAEASSRAEPGQGLAQYPLPMPQALWTANGSPAASQSSGIVSPFALSPTPSSRIQPDHASWESLPPELDSPEMRGASSGQQGYDAFGPASHDLPTSPLGSLPAARFPQVSTAIPFRGAVRGNFSFSLATQRSIPSSTGAAPVPDVRPAPGAGNSTSLTDFRHSDSLTGGEQPVMTSQASAQFMPPRHRAAMLTAASMESNASGVLLVSNPLALRSAAGAADVFLNPLVSHRSNLGRSGSHDVRSHPLAELGGDGQDGLLDPSPPSSAPGRWRTPPPHTAIPLPSRPDSSQAAAVSIGMPAGDRGTMYQHAVPDQAADDAGGSQPGSAPLMNPSVTWRPVAEAAEHADLHAALLACTALPSEPSASTLGADEGSSFFQRPLRQQHHQPFWQPLRSRARHQPTMQPQAAPDGQHAQHSHTAGTDQAECAAVLLAVHQHAQPRQPAASNAWHHLSQRLQSWLRPAKGDALPTTSSTSQHGATAQPDHVPSSRRITGGTASLDMLALHQCQHGHDLTALNANHANEPSTSESHTFPNRITGASDTGPVLAMAGNDASAELEAVASQSNTLYETTEQVPQNSSDALASQQRFKPFARGLRKVAGWLTAASKPSMTPHHPEPLSQPLEGPLLDSTGSEGHMDREEGGEGDGGSAGPGFYRAPLGLHQFGNWAMAATRRPHPFPRPPNLARPQPATMPRLNANSRILSQGQEGGYAHRWQHAWQAIRARLAGRQAGATCQAPGADSAEELRLAAWLMVVQAWRHRCNLIMADLVWTILTSLVVGGSQGMSPDPSMQRLPVDMAVAIVVLGLVSAGVSLPLLSAWRLRWTGLPSSHPLPATPSYPGRFPFMASALAWQVSMWPTPYMSM